jgi:hypothetical protein
MFFTDCSSFLRHFFPAATISSAEMAQEVQRTRPALHRLGVGGRSRPLMGSAKGSMSVAAWPSGKRPSRSRQRRLFVVLPRQGC